MANSRNQTGGKVLAPPTRKLPPQDSLITLGPGRTLTLDVSSNQEWAEKTRAFREIRGNILSACFSVEFALDRLISETFFPGVETPGARAFFSPVIG